MTTLERSVGPYTSAAVLTGQTLARPTRGGRRRLYLVLLGSALALATTSVTLVAVLPALGSLLAR